MAKNRIDPAGYQHANALAARGKAFDLAAIDPGAKPYSSGDKAQDQAGVEALAIELDRLQDMFYADRRFKMLVVLQGTDTSGKDGVLRGVFGRMSPLGVHTIGWKAPTDDERARDYLWRIHARVPANGEVVVLNRSHYEDVLVPVVNGWITPKQAGERYAQIADFERMLSETGTLVVKFMLHISKDEQRARLQERLDDPDKRWKFCRRPGGAQALVGLPDRVCACDRCDRNALGAVDGGSGRLEDAPQPDDRDADEAGLRGPETALSARRPRPRDAARGVARRPSRTDRERTPHESKDLP